MMDIQLVAQPTPGLLPGCAGISRYPDFEKEHYHYELLEITDLPAYNDTLGTRPKCHCKQMASYCITVPGVTVSGKICKTKQRRWDK